MKIHLPIVSYPDLLSGLMKQSPATGVVFKNTNEIKTGAPGGFGLVVPSIYSSVPE